MSLRLSSLLTGSDQSSCRSGREPEEAGRGGRPAGRRRRAALLVKVDDVGDWGRIFDDETGKVMHIGYQARSK